MYSLTLRRLGVKLTERAVGRLRAINGQLDNLAPGKKQALKLEITGGGCSGFQYHFSLVSEDSTNTNDLIVTASDSMLIVDSSSAALLKNCEVDYEETLKRSAFFVARNEIAQSGCGCGNSFST